LRVRNLRKRLTSSENEVDSIACPKYGGNVRFIAFTFRFFHNLSPTGSVDFCIK